MVEKTGNKQKCQNIGSGIDIVPGHVQNLLLLTLQKSLLCTQNCAILTVLELTFVATLYTLLPCVISTKFDEKKQPKCLASLTVFSTQWVSKNYFRSVSKAPPPLDKKLRTPIVWNPYSKITVVDITFYCFVQLFHAWLFSAKA